MSALYKVKEKKVFITDSLWSILSLCMMNVMSQIVLYPILRRVLGAEEYGNVLYLISIINIAGTTIGSSANSARLVASVKGKTYNSDSSLFIMGAWLLMLPVCMGVLHWGGFDDGAFQVMMTWLLTGATIWRFYADVNFRLTTNYRGYFKYYLCITLGYALGGAIFYATKVWQLILLPGELAGLVYVGVKGSVLQRDGRIDRLRFKGYIVSVMNLALAAILSNVVFNADRLILKNMIDGEAVTLYYVASLMGKTIALVTVPLNSVIIGHLAKSKGNMSAKSYLMLSGLGVILTGVALVICVLGSHIFAYLFYPQEYEAAKSLFWTANLAQIFYFASGILTMVMLRYLKEYYQLVISAGSAVLFVVAAIFGTLKGGIQGFTWALLIANVFRYFLAVVIGAVELSKMPRLNEGES